MQAIRTIAVTTSFPPEIEDLEAVSRNLYWTWNPAIREFLRSIDPAAWHRFNHSPLKVLGNMSYEELETLAKDKEFVSALTSARTELDRYVEDVTWYQQEFGGDQDCIAYFSAEFGIHESIPLYSGGLGVLSGDHAKAASDLGLPFVGVGLLYQMGYFRQRLALDGTQYETYDYNDPSVLPVRRLRDDSGDPITVEVELPEESLTIGVWEMSVGRVPIYLLDTNLPENRTPHLRDLTGYLYGGDTEMRILQEIVLGIGGMRTLRRLGVEPVVTHCNEGHSAFLLLERTRHAMERFGMTYPEAARLTSAGSVFTTHTPVPAGHDAFTATMIERYLKPFRESLGLSAEEFMSLGRVDPDDHSESFSMTVLALRLTSGRNGVSKMHAHVSREMWHDIWPAFIYDEIPIQAITNGIHHRTFLSDRMQALLDKHLGSDWDAPGAPLTVWSNANEIPDEDMWEVSNAMRAEMIMLLRGRLIERQSETYARDETGRDLEHILDPTALTIGFARRFAEYKRATLLFRDRDRAYRLFADNERPVQLLIAGKAHPKDEAGKKLIREIFAFVREMGLEHRIMFIEDYDIGVARAMVQGCDVWLNTPRRPLEASGTSGMKAALNGTLNLSILDGWFPEAFDGSNGFAIGDDRDFVDAEYQDEIESRKLYQILEEELVPRFYDRDSSGLPRGWIEIQKQTLATIPGEFSSDRMVREYVSKLYQPAANRYGQLIADDATAARNLSAWIYHVRSFWSDIRIGTISFDPDLSEQKHRDTIQISAMVEFGRIAPDNLRVQAVVGTVDSDGQIQSGTIWELEQVSESDSTGRFSGTIRFDYVGKTGVTVRVIPACPELLDPPDVGLVVWKRT